MNDTTIKLLLDTLDTQPENWKIRIHIAELMAADFHHDRAADLLNDYEPLPEEESLLLSIASIHSHANSDKALRILDLIITNNKACAMAYRIKANIYQARGMEPEARKNYNVAAVIDESLEDEEFESWLDNGATQAPLIKNSTNKPSPPKSSAPTDKPQTQPQKRIPFLRNSSPSKSEPTNEAEIEKDDFIETDAALDRAISNNLPQIDFSDIGGMEELKERIRMSIIYPFKNKELFKKFKKSSGGGILFYGPPGCGKTLISRATAGECGAHFMNISITDILSKWVGESEQRLHQIFETARRKSPTILFIDEVDALGVKRSDAGQMASMVNTLLTEIDGVESHNEDLLIIGATNTPWRIDSAFRRPGRFDHVLFVTPPDLQARESIFKIMLDGVPQEKLDISKLAKVTDRFSGADIKAAVDSASEATIQEIMRTGKEGVVTQKSLLNSIKKTRPTTLEWVEQASNYASYANQSGLYDDLAEFIRKF